MRLGYNGTSSSKESSYDEDANRHRGSNTQKYAAVLPAGIVRMRNNIGRSARGDRCLRALELVHAHAQVVHTPVVFK